MQPNPTLLLLINYIGPSLPILGWCYSEHGSRNKVIGYCTSCLAVARVLCHSDYFRHRFPSSSSNFPGAMNKRIQKSTLDSSGTLFVLIACITKGTISYEPVYLISFPVVSGYSLITETTAEPPMCGWYWQFLIVARYWALPH